MSGETCLLDTNVLVHAYAVADEQKHQTARLLVERVWAGQRAATTIQNLCEFFAVVTRKVARPIPTAHAGTIVQGILSASHWEIIDRGPASLMHAVELVKQRRAKFWDALIAAAMLEHGLGTIVTENVRDFRRIPGIRVVNPFKGRPARP